MDLEKLLKETEDTLYFISCLMPLVYNADQEQYCLEIRTTLEKVEKMADEAMEKVTNALLLMEIEKREKASA